MTPVRGAPPTGRTPERVQVRVNAFGRRCTSIHLRLPDDVVAIVNRAAKEGGVSRNLFLTICIEEAVGYVPPTRPTGAPK